MWSSRPPSTTSSSSWSPVVAGSNEMWPANQGHPGWTRRANSDKKKRKLKNSGNKNYTRLGKYFNYLNKLFVLMSINNYDWIFT